MSCNGPTSINFIILTLIRGTTPLTLFFAADQLNSSSLVVAIKCAITLVLFTLSALWQANKDVEIRFELKKSFDDQSLFWRIGLVGFLQSFAPYILATFSVQYLPPAIVGVFIVTIPWFGIIMERLPFVNLRQKIPTMIKSGMFCGLVGICLMLAPVINGSLSCSTINPSHIVQLNVTNTTKPPHRLKKFRYTCENGFHLAIGVIALFLAPVLWGMASVFWKLRRRDTHPLVQSIGQNLVGAVLGSSMYGITRAAGAIEKHEWNTTKFITSILFLGVLTGWMATLLVQYLYKNIGARTTNQVLTGIPFIAFVQDTIFLRDVVTLEPYIIAMEIAGLLLVTGGVFISNLPSADFDEETSSGRRRSSLSEALLDEGSASEGIVAGLDQAYSNSIHQYVPVHQQETDTIHDDEEHLTETEEEINSPSEMRSRTPFPKLTQVT